MRSLPSGTRRWPATSGSPHSSFCDVADVGRPHAALRMLHVCGVRRYQHLLHGLSPRLSRPALERADAVVLVTTDHVLRVRPADIPPAAYSAYAERIRLPTRMGAHVASFLAVAHELHSRVSRFPASLARFFGAGCGSPSGPHGLSAGYRPTRRRSGGAPPAGPSPGSPPLPSGCGAGGSPVPHCGCAHLC